MLSMLSIMQHTYYTQSHSGIHTALKDICHALEHGTHNFKMSVYNQCGG